MNLKRSFLALYSMLIIFLAMAPATYGNSKHAPSDGDPISISLQLLEFLEQIDISHINEERKVLVDIMINARGELLVLSTNDNDFDSIIKAKFNYKKLINHSLQINQTYTIPILFRNKES